MTFTWGILSAITAIFAVGYLLLKISRGVGYFGKRLSGNRRMIVTAGIAILLFVPAAFAPRIWIIGLLHMVVLLLLSDIIALLAKAFRKRKKVPKFWYGFYRSGFAAIILTAVLISYGYYNIYHIVRTEYTVTVEKPIREEGYKIAMLSDLHYGTTLDGAQLKEVGYTIAEEEADIIILDGDIVDENTTFSQMREAFSILGEIPSRYGTYFVYGNHDRGTYSSNPNYTEEQLADAISGAGIHILEDSTDVINGELVLIGRGDSSFGDADRESIAQLVADLDPDMTWVVLDHQPTEYEEAEKSGCDLILSGHTHAGQIWPAGIFADALKLNDMNYGYRKQGNLNAIVSSGVAGWGFPVRTEKHSEYVVIQMKGLPR